MSRIFRSLRELERSQQNLEEVCEARFATMLRRSSRQEAVRTEGFFFGGTSFHTVHCYDVYLSIKRFDDKYERDIEVATKIDQDNRGQWSQELLRTFELTEGYLQRRDLFLVKGVVMEPNIVECSPAVFATMQLGYGEMISEDYSGYRRSGAPISVRIPSDAPGERVLGHGLWISRTLYRVEGERFFDW